MQRRAETMQDETFPDQDEFGEDRAVAVVEPVEVAKRPRNQPEFTETGVTFPRGMSYAAWQEVGSGLQRMHTSYQYWLGDWIIYGDTKWGEKYTQAVILTGNQVQSLMDIVSVCRSVGPSRRRAELTFQHHREVMGLPPKQQDEWLQKSVANEWSSRELNRQLKLHFNPPQEVQQSLDDVDNTVDAPSETDLLYEDRNMVVLLAATLAQDMGQSVGVRDDPATPGYVEVVITLPEGQVSWHVPLAQLDGINFPEYAEEHDGHSRADKLARIKAFVTVPMEPSDAEG